jgi:signal transduction histidine kinase
MSRFAWTPPDPPVWRDRHGRRRGPHPAPAVFAVFIALLFQVLGANAAAHAGAVARPLDLPSVTLLVIGPVALLWRRRFPIPVLAVAAAASLGFATFAEPRWMYAVAPVIALFAAVRTGHARPALITAVAAYVAYVLITVIFAGVLHVPAAARPDLPTLIVLALGVSVTAILAGASKARGEYMAEMAKVRAERARAREELQKRQTSEERLRIARELHDVLGHHLSLINVQAGVGLHLMDSRPEQAREALTAIKTASSEALREVRAVLGVLRPEDEAAPRQPALGLDRLDDLTADAGLPVKTTVTGDRRPLPPEVDRAAYRIVQEALTNVRRHAPAGSAEVGVAYEPGRLTLSVRNTPGGAATAEAGGSGIAGMRARAEALGGTFSAGPLDGGGFLVSAVLPASDAGEPE